MIAGRLRLLCICLVMTALSAVAAEQYGNVIVTPIPLGARGNNYLRGYQEFRFKVQNLSMSKGHRVKLVYPNHSYGGGGERIKRITRTATVGPGASVEVAFYQPAIQVSGSGGVKVYIDGTAQKKVLHFSYGSSYGGYYGGYAKRILSARGINMQDLDTALEKTLPKKTSRSRHRSDKKWTVIRAEADVEDWSDSWLAYTCYDSIVLPGGKIEDMKPAVRAALYKYILAGGIVMVFGEHKLPADMHAENSRRWNFDVQYAGFGMLIGGKDNDISKLSDSKSRQFLSLMDEGSFHWKDRNRAANSVLKAFPVVANLRIPVKGMFVLVLLFAVVIGPVNLIVLARIKRKIWMLWTVPAISFAACIAVIAYSLLSEGVTPTVRIESLTLLNQKTRNSTTLGMAAYYCPLTPEDGLHFSYDCELTPIVHGRHYGEGSAREMDWSRDQHLRSGWVTARIPAYFMVRKSETRRERVDLSVQEDGSLAVVNGLGVDIKKIYLVDKAGKSHECQAVKAGKQSSMKPVKTRHRAGAERLWRTFARTEWARHYDDCSKSPYRYLKPGMYMAVLDSAPFIDRGLAGKAKGESKSIVIGIMSEEGQNEGE